MSLSLDATGIARELSRGLGLPCSAIEGQDIGFGRRSRSLLVVFVNGLGGAEGLWIVEHSLAVGIAGASRHATLESLRTALHADRIPEDLSEGLDAFLGAAFGQREQADLVYRHLIVDPDESRMPDVDALLLSAPHRADFQVTVQGYGSGRLSVLGS